MQNNPEMLQIELEPNGEYKTQTKISDERIEAVFSVKHFSKPKRYGIRRHFKNHKKSIEKLEEEAQKTIKQFCQKISEGLSGTPVH